MAAILITGGTGKFGRVFVRHFLDKGWDVVFTSTSQAKLDEMLEGIGVPATRVAGFLADFRHDGAADRLIEEVASQFGPINCLVNNARSLESLKVGPDGWTEREPFQAEFLIDVIAPYELSVAAILQFTDDLKSIVNIGSQYGVVAANPSLYEGEAQRAPIQYGVSKAALMHLTKELAVRFAKRGVRVNCVAYGGVAGRVDEAFERRYATLCPTGSMVSEDHLAGPVEFLASDMSAGMTGETILVDGGWTLW